MASSHWKMVKLQFLENSVAKRGPSEFVRSVLISSEVTEVGKIGHEPSAALNNSFEVGYDEYDEKLYTDLTLGVAPLFSHEDIHFLAKVLERRGLQGLNWLVFNNFETTSFMNEFNLSLNNKIVFAILPRNTSTFHLLDAYRVTSSSELRISGIGIWSPSVGLQKSNQPNLDSGSEPSFPVLQTEDFRIWKRRNNLSGLFVRCLTMESASYTLVETLPDGSIEVKGPFGELWSYLHKVLNFTYECEVVAGNVYGSYDDVTQSWNGAVGELVTKRADVAVVDFSIMYTRAQVIDFSDHIEFEYNLLVYERSSTTSLSSWDSYLREFAPNVWFALLATLGLSALTFNVISKVSPIEKRYSFSDSFLFIFCVFCSIGYCEFFFESVGGRLFFITVVAFIIVVYASYTSSLIAYLTVKDEKPPFTDIRGLYAKRNEYRFAVYKGTNLISTFKDSLVSLYQKVWKEMLEPYQNEFPSNFIEAKPKIVKGKYVVIYFFAGVDTTEDCNMWKFPLDIKTSIAWGLQKNSPLRDIFNYHMNQFLASGSYKRVKRQHVIVMNRKYTVYCDAKLFNPIAISSIYFALQLLALGIIFGILFLAVEKLINVPNNFCRKILNWNLN